MKFWARPLWTTLLLAAMLGVTDAGVKDGDKGKQRLGGPVAVPLVAGTPAAGRVLFTESFEGAAFPPVGWTMRNADGNVGSSDDPSDTSWFQSEWVGGTVGLPVYDGKWMAAAYFNTANGLLLDDWLITPNTGDAAPVQTVDSLVCYVASRLSVGGNYPDSLDIRVSTDDRTLDSFTRLRYMNVPKNAWERVALLLPQAANRYIGFRYYLTYGGPNVANSDKVVLDLVQIVRYSTVSVEPAGTALPASVSLSQNFPNPFNPSTRIRFALPEAANATLTIYSILGQEIATLLSGTMAAGTYDVTFDATGLPSGMYLYRLTAGSSSATRPMMLLK